MKFTKEQTEEVVATLNKMLEMAPDTIRTLVNHRATIPMKVAHNAEFPGTCLAINDKECVMGIIGILNAFMADGDLRIVAHYRNDELHMFGVLNPGK
jgi:hypothetical protein